jgi:hypothetical protein
MNSITLSRTIDASPERVREAIEELEPFMEASGFDDVTVDGRMIHVANHMGFATIELTLEIVDDPGAFLAYEQREGIFSEMRTTYEVQSTNGGTEIEAMTEFELDVAIVGNILDSTVIKRQRRRELTAQFEWLEDVCDN